MEAVTFVWPEWSVESVESENANSVVYRARRVEFGETLYAAIKITKVPVEAGQNRAEVRRRIDEWCARMAGLRQSSSLLVPEDIQVVDADGGFAVHMRMEYCTRLAVYAASHALSAEELIEMGVDICTALDALEKAGIVHGDVRPEHIFVSKRGSYRLGGFGLSRALQAAAPVGIPEPQAAYYMAPEVYRGATPGPQSDLYSLGMVIYRTLNNGRMPFLPNYPEPVSAQDRLDALARRMAGEKLPAPQTGSAALVAPVLHACEADPAARYSSPAAFRQDLRSYLKSTGAGFTAASIGASAGAAGSAATATAVKAPRTPSTSAQTKPAAQKTAGIAKASASQASASQRKRMSPKLTGVLIAAPLVIILVAGLAILSALGILPSIGGSQTTTAATTEATTTTTMIATTTTTTAATTQATTTTRATTTTTTRATTTTEATTEATTTTEAIEYYTDELVTVQTKLNPAEVNRTTNVRLACENVNGKELAPGEEFSFNDTVGPRTEARGFKDAKIYLAGEIADGTGGGICQVSSTIYMAAIRADLKITERRNHRYTVSYAPEGEDATVSWGNQDFKFVNNTEYPIKLLVTQEGSYVTVTIMGTKTENKTVEIQTERLEYTPYETLTIVDETMEPGTTREGNQSGHSGKKTVSYRLVYVDGELVSKTLENYSTYMKLDVVTYVGPEITTSVTGEPDQTGTGQATAPSWIGGGADTTATTPDQPDQPGQTTSDSQPDQPGQTTSDSQPDQPDQTTAPGTSSSSSDNGPPAWLGGGN